MKNKSGLFIGATFALLAFTACGRSYQGSYRGYATMVPNYSGVTTGYGQTSTTTGAYSQTLTLSLNDQGPENVTGTFTSESNSGTIQGHANGSGIDNVVLTLGSSYSNYNNTGYNSGYNSGYNYGYGYTQPYYGNTSSCTGTFTGNLTLSGNRLTGRLNAINTTLASTCTIKSIDIDAQK